MTQIRRSTAFLVPLKSFDDAKERLEVELPPADRSQLMKTLAEGVLRAAAGFPRWVVCDDVAVAQFGIDQGAQVIWRGGGLNPSVQSAAEQLALEGFDRVIVSHGDIAHPTSFAAFVPGAVDSARESTDDLLLIGSDRFGDGSNVVSVPLGCGFTFAYGPGSFGRHTAEAERCELGVEEVSDARLQLDVDTPADLALYRTKQ